MCKVDKHDIGECGPDAYYAGKGEERGGLTRRLRAAFASAADTLADLLFPPRCPFCDRVVFRGEACAACREDFGIRAAAWRCDVSDFNAVKETVAEIPLDRILLETDCPYLAPVPHRGHLNESAYIPLIAAKIAGIKGIPVETVEAVTTDNARKLFRL